MDLNIKTKLYLLHINFLCSYLFVKNLLLTKKLRIEHTIHTNKLTIQGNQAKINWKAEGCHRIIINNFIVLPGSVSHINLNLTHKKNEIEITFYGTGGQKKIKKIVIKTTSPSLLKSFLIRINISKLSSVPMIREDLKRTLNTTFNYQIPKIIKLNKPKILTQKLRINFEPFIKI